MTHLPDKLPSDFPDPITHAGVILDTLQGDYELALEALPGWVEIYGLDYCRRLLFFLAPQGHA